MNEEQELAAELAEMTEANRVLKGLLFEATNLPDNMKIVDWEAFRKRCDDVMNGIPESNQLQLYKYILDSIMDEDMLEEHLEHAVRHYIADDDSRSYGPAGKAKWECPECGYEQMAGSIIFGCPKCGKALNK